MDGKSSGIVFGWEPYNGSATPSATVLADRSRFGTDGAITGATWVRQANGLWGLDFDSATPDYVEVTCPQCNFTSEDFSIVARVTLDSLASEPRVFCRGYSSADGYDLFVQTNGSQVIRTSQGAVSQDSKTPAGSIAINTKYTYGLSRIGTSCKLFRDGVDITSVIGAHTDPLTCNRTTKIGVYDNKVSAPFDGQISFLRVYNRALSAGEHLQIHNELVTL